MHFWRFICPFELPTIAKQNVFLEIILYVMDVFIAEGSYKRV